MTVAPSSWVKVIAQGFGRRAVGVLGGRDPVGVLPAVAQEVVGRRPARSRRWRSRRAGSRGRGPSSSRRTASRHRSRCRPLAVAPGASDGVPPRDDVVHPRGDGGLRRIGRTAGELGRRDRLGRGLRGEGDGERVSERDTSRGACPSPRRRAGSCWSPRRSMRERRDPEVEPVGRGGDGSWVFGDRRGVVEVVFEGSESATYASVFESVANRGRPRARRRRPRAPRSTSRSPTASRCRS